MNALPIDQQPVEPSSHITRRMAADRALASAKLEGFVPNEKFLALFERHTMGEITTDEAVAIVISEAQAEQKERDRQHALSSRPD